MGFRRIETVERRGPETSMECVGIVGAAYRGEGRARPELLRVWGGAVSVGVPRGRASSGYSGNGISVELVQFVVGKSDSMVVVRVVEVRGWARKPR